MTDQITGSEKPGGSSSKNEVDFLKYLMGAVIAVLAVGFVTMLISVFDIFIGNESSAQQSYENLQNQVQAQNTQIQDMSTQLRDSTVTTH